MSKSDLPNLYNEYKMENIYYCKQATKDAKNSAPECSWNFSQENSETQSNTLDTECIVYI